MIHKISLCGIWGVRFVHGPVVVCESVCCPLRVADAAVSADL